jgi:galactokinase/mevalonate kinase-like predicted kinase
MWLTRKRAYARAGLIGNPSDGYNGKTISVIVPDFFAEVTLYEWDQVELVWSRQDQHRFRSIDDLVHDVQQHGYYGGIRLVRATIKKFADYCHDQGFKLKKQNFSIRYDSSIPRMVGLAGSSAIITATLRALIDFYEITIPKKIQPSLILAVETEELGIPGGLQDRVAQVYEGLIAMDFTESAMHSVEGFKCGTYERLAPSLLPPLYITYSEKLGNPTERIHDDLRGRYLRGEPDVVKAMRALADLTDEAREALLTGQTEKWANLIDRNFDLRRSICLIPDNQIQMVLKARECGASAKFCGSGGAIVGTYQGDEMFNQLEDTLSTIGCRTFRLSNEIPEQLNDQF